MSRQGIMKQGFVLSSVLVFAGAVSAHPGAPSGVRCAPQVHAAGGQHQPACNRGSSEGVERSAQRGGNAPAQTSGNAPGQAASVRDHGAGKSAARTNHGRRGTPATHGNNGVGNGTDPQPPGNPPVNDGAGTSPGNPGQKANG